MHKESLTKKNLYKKNMYKEKSYELKRDMWFLARSYMLGIFKKILQCEQVA
jgi:hypothetical protein